MAEVQHTVGGKPAMTIGELADRYGIESYETMRSILGREAVEPAARVDGKILLYLVEKADAAMANRKGTPGRPRKHPK